MKMGSRARPAIPPIPTGTYIAVCIGVVELGRQESVYNGKTRYTDKVRIIFEIPSQRIEVDGEEVPRWISRDFALTSAPNGNLRGFVQTWLGKTFSDMDAGEFELFDLLGQQAMLSTVVSEDGKYANINSAIPLPDGMIAPPATSQFIKFDVEEWDDDAFAALPEYLQKKIMNSMEYRDKHLPEDTVSVEAAEAAASAAAESEGRAPF